MKKTLSIVLIMILTLSITACDGKNIVSSGKSTNDKLPTSLEVASKVNLTTEKGIIDYLVGEWISNNPYMSDVECIMNIDEDLNIHLSFYNHYEEIDKGEFWGRIDLERFFADDNEAPDLISIELASEKYPGGDYLFRHNTLYDGKQVMSWFYAGNGICVFGLMDSFEFFGFPLVETIFEKTTGEKGLSKPKSDLEFYGVFWGWGDDDESLWLDDVTIDKKVGDDHNSITEYGTHLYENKVQQSVLYNIEESAKEEVLGDYYFPGSVHMVSTNEEGEIIDVTWAGVYNEDLWHSTAVEYEDDYGVENQIMNIIDREVTEIDYYLETGMSMIIDGSTEEIDGDIYYIVILGTNHEEHFVRELFYGINPETGYIYKYDVITDSWAPLPMG